jgi:hypothetical protein
LRLHQPKRRHRDNRFEVSLRRVHYHQERLTSKNG